MGYIAREVRRRETRLVVAGCHGANAIGEFDDVGVGTTKSIILRMVSNGRSGCSCPADMLLASRV